MNDSNRKPTDNHVLVIEDNNSSRTISLDKSKYSLGRHSSNSIVIHSRQVSRQHATLVKKFNRQTNCHSFWIIDGDLDGNKSQNGVFINGEKCLVHELKDGDLINFGCEVNASYHSVSKVKISDSSIDESSLKEDTLDSPPVNKLPKLNVENPHQKSTFLLPNVSENSSGNEDTFREDSYLDPVTNLPNRILFNEYISIALANAKRHDNNTAIFLLDIENFSQINDTFGYKVGDHFLAAMGKRLKNCLRIGDIVARWGGDEFGILLPHIKEADNLYKITQRLVKELKYPFTVDQKTESLVTHLGVAIYPENGKSPQELLNYAETQLSHHKQTGNHDIVALKSPGKSSELSQIEGRLYDALNKKELCLYYQPQVNLNSKKIEGMEAFIRWNHPKYGLVPPQQFLPWAEKTELVIPLTRWIFEQACRQNKTWQTNNVSPISVSVNLSAAQFHHSQLVDIVDEVLSSTKLDPQWLELEVTESIILKDIKLAYEILTELKALGVNLCVDDFGIGYIAVSNLHTMPFDKIKIDVSLIRDLANNPDNTTLISALLSLGETFKMRVVAEGVETQQQLNLLNDLHCQGMQGYRFSHPLSVEKATEFLTRYHGKKS
ncbi:MAG: EAL domain-containing protein [Crocosphaera sp.]